MISMQVTIKQLREQSVISVGELARLANVDYRTSKKADNGEKVTRIKLIAILTVLNARLGTSYTIEQLSQPHD